MDFSSTSVYVFSTTIITFSYYGAATTAAVTMYKERNGVEKIKFIIHMSIIIQYR